MKNAYFRCVAAGLMACTFACLEFRPAVAAPDEKPNLIQRSQIKRSELENAVRSGDAAAVEKLLEQGADAKTLTENPYAALGMLYRGSEPIAPTQRTKNISMLMLAAAAGNVEDPVERAPYVEQSVVYHFQKNSNENVFRSGIFKPSPQPKPREDLKMMEALLKRGVDIEAKDEFGRTAFFWASAFAGNLANTKFLLSRKADPNVRDTDGKTPLFYAIARRDYPLLRAMLEGGADPNIKDAKGQMLLPGVLGREWNQTALLLLEFGADPLAHSSDVFENLPALFLAIRFQNKKLIEAMLQKSFDVNFADKNGKTALFHALDAKDDATADALIRLKANLNAKDKNGDTPLIKAVSSENGYMVRRLLDQGVSTKDRATEWALETATRRERMDVLKLLLRRGVNPNAHARNDGQATILMSAVHSKNPLPIRILLDAGAKANARDAYGETALHRAVSGRDNSAVIQMLLKAGIDVDTRTREGRTALHHAAWTEGNDVVIQTLLQAGADVDARALDGTTALWLAASTGYLKNVRSLVAAGAQLNLRDKKGRTALSQATKNRYGLVVAFLKKAGAKP